MSAFENVLEEIGERLGGKSSFQLLYKTTDKVDVKEFHRKCDGKGPTVTILHGTYNTVFGGYTSQNWNSPKYGQKVCDEEAFLFTKNDNPNAKCNFLPIKKEKADIAITRHERYGPTFGGGTLVPGYDLQAFRRDIFAESVFKNNSLYLNGSLNIGNAYSAEVQNIEGNQNNANAAKTKRLTSKDINSGKLTVTRLEVYQVKDDEFGEPWFNVQEEKEYMKTKADLVKMKTLHGLDIIEYNILLVGAIGAGKSSFINTLSTVFTGKVEHIAQARNSETSVTSQVKGYNIRTEKGKLKMCFYDIRGIDAERGYGKELDLMLKGKLPKDYQFPDKEDDDIKEVANPTLKDKIHLVCMVEGMFNFGEYPPKVLKYIQEIRETVAQNGLPMVVVATKFDKLCPTISKRVDHLIKCRKARDAFLKISIFHGVSESDIFPVVNFTRENEPDDIINQLALKAIYGLYTRTKEYLSQHEDLKDIDFWTERSQRLVSRNNSDEKETTLRNVHEKLSNMQKKDIRILLVGPMHSGKSSFIDSIISALVGKINNEAMQDSSFDQKSNSASTDKFQLYCVEYLHDHSEKKRSSVYIGDTPGFREAGDIQEDHIKFIIRGKIPNNYKIVKGAYDIQQLDKCQTPDNKIHCVGCIFDCESLQTGLSKDLTASMMKVMEIIKTEGCPYIVVLTKCDKVSESGKQINQLVFEDENVRICKDKILQLFGSLSITQQQIFPVVNYVHENSVNQHTDILLLDAFSGMLEIGSRRLEKEEGAQK